MCVCVCVQAPSPRFSRTPGVAVPAPEVGTHSEELLQAVGYSDAEIEQLMKTVRAITIQNDLAAAAAKILNAKKRESFAITMTG